jgi:hypothetical protein
LGETPKNKDDGTAILINVTFGQCVSGAYQERMLEHNNTWLGLFELRR